MFQYLDKLVQSRSWNTVMRLIYKKKEHQEYAVKSIINSGELFMANEFINTLKMNKKLFQINENDIEKEKKMKNKLYYQIDLNLNKIHLINNNKKIKKLKQIVLEKHKYIGMDVKYLSSKFGILKKRASLLQLSTSNAVYIIDLACLCLNEELNQILKYIMLDVNIYKIGFLFSNDILILKNTSPKLDAFKKMKSSIDLEKIWNSYSEIYNIEIDKSHLELSDICKKILGKPIDNTLQFSDWGKRPLMPEQVNYAALDVYILLKIFKIMHRRLIKNPKFIS